MTRLLIRHIGLSFSVVFLSGRRRGSFPLQCDGDFLVREQQWTSGDSTLDFAKAREQGQSLASTSDCTPSNFAMVEHGILNSMQEGGITGATAGFSVSAVRLYLDAGKYVNIDLNTPKGKVPLLSSSSIASAATIFRPSVRFNVRNAPLRTLSDHVSHSFFVIFLTADPRIHSTF